MKRQMFSALMVGLFAVAVAQGHALYIVADATDATKVQVVFSDELAPDSRVKAESWKKVDGLKLLATDASGKPAPVKWVMGEHCLTATVPAGTKQIDGQVNYGFSPKAGAKPTVIVFYCKAILGGTVPENGGKTDAELQVLPKIEGGKVRFLVLHAGKPVPDLTISVMLPAKNGETPKEDATTDAAGMTQAFEGAGRYGVTARKSEEKSGELDGKKYEVVSHSATLVVDVK